MSNPAKPPPIRRRAPVPKDICPLAQSAELLGDRWTLLILREAFYGVVRYDDMLQDLGAPRSTLTERLAKLVSHGLMARQTYKEPGSRARDAYVLTAAGRALGPTLIALSQWGETFVTRRPAPVMFMDEASASPARAALLNKAGEEVSLQNVRIKLRKPRTP